MLVETATDASGTTLTRMIHSFVEQDGLYERHDETHRLRLIDPDDLREELQTLGFEVNLSTAYGTVTLPTGCMSFLARKSGG